MKKYNKPIFILSLMLAAAASVLYSEGEKLFPHNTHKENDVECPACHPGAKTSVKAGDNLFPKKTVCAKECHEKEILEKVAFVSSKPGLELNFNHEIHVEQDIKCIKCHAGINSKDFKKGSAFPPMKTCYECHNGDDAPKTCTLCHAGKVPFPHYTHKENDVACKDCHKTAPTSKKASDNNYPQKSICAEECHEKDIVAIVGLSESKPRWKLKFNHEIHVEQDIKCLTCHDGINKKDFKKGSAYPPMKVCFKCHNGDDAPKTCTLCHEGKVPFPHKLHIVDNELGCEECHKEIKNSTTTRGGRDIPKKNVCYDCHEAKLKFSEVVDFPYKQTYEFNHKFHTVDQELECKECHKKLYEKEHPEQKELVPKMEYCFECHDNDTATQYCMLCHLNPTKPRNHYYDWDNFHRKSANRDIQNCISCHQSKQFCVSCHKGIKKPEKTHNSNFEVTHRFEARTSLKNCFSCHSRRQCLSCHISYGVSYRSKAKIKNVHGSLETWISSRHRKAGKLRITTCTACHVKSDCYGCHNPTNVGPRKR